MNVGRLRNICGTGLPVPYKLIFSYIEIDSIIFWICSGNIYDPLGMATRAEITTIFARFVDIYINNALENASANTNAATANATSLSSVTAYVDKSALEELEQARTGDKTE